MPIDGIERSVCYMSMYMLSTQHAFKILAVGIERVLLDRNLWFVNSGGIDETHVEFISATTVHRGGEDEDEAPTKYSSEYVNPLNISIYNARGVDKRNTHAGSMIYATYPDWYNIFYEVSIDPIINM